MIIFSGHLIFKTKKTESARERDTEVKEKKEDLIKVLISDAPGS